MFAAKDGAGGLLLLPGSKRAGHAGVLYGMDGNNFGRENVARAALEALLLELSSGLERMREIGVKPETIRLTGGGSADAEVRRLVADVMGVAVLPLRGEVSPAMGAALQAAWTFFHQSGEDLTFEEITSYAVAPEEGQRCEPNQARFKFYQDLLKRQEALVETVQGEQWAKGGHG
jgi:xylulokinase